MLGFPPVLSLLGNMLPLTVLEMLTQNIFQPGVETHGDQAVKSHPECCLQRNRNKKSKEMIRASGVCMHFITDISSTACATGGDVLATVSQLRSKIHSIYQSVNLRLEDASLHMVHLDLS
jgi:hypothetical protein